ncbi:MAG: hypothetical protein NTX03_02605 [Bacteroidetes bacterium]|nr:hypothetical protein [Bacteroidota bacterium]
METSEKNVLRSQPILLIALIVLFACWGLFYLDHETKSINDLFKVGNLVALVLYFLPTFIICVLLHNWAAKKQWKNRISFSLLLGIPVGFIIVILGLFTWMP